MSANRSLIAVTVVCALGGSLAPLAASEAATPDASSLGETGIEEIIVTAQKRSERLQDVPIAITAVGQDVIQGLGAKTLDDGKRMSITP